MKTLRLKAILMSILLTISPLLAAAAGGESGGGSVGQKVGDEIIPLDFLEGDQPLLVSDNLTFLKAVPGFEEMIMKLANAHPHFTTEIIHDLLSVNIWLSQKPIPRMPESVTSIVDSGANIQIAFRDGNNIVISEPAFRISIAQPYTILHEALHPKIPGTGPFHHMHVRATVKQIFDNQNVLTLDLLNSIFRKNGVILRTPSLDAPDQLLLTSLLIGQPDPLLACAIHNLIGSSIVFMRKNGEVNNLSWGFDGKVRSSLAKWSGLNCGDHDYVKYFIRELPNLGAAFKVYPQYTSINEVSGLGFFANKYEREMFRIGCRDYTKPELKTKALENLESNKEGLRVVDLALKELEQIKNQIANTENDVRLAFIKVIIEAEHLTESYSQGLHPKDLNETRSGLVDNNKTLQEAIVKFNKNVKTCAD